MGYQPSSGDNPPTGTPTLVQPVNIDSEGIAAIQKTLTTNIENWKQNVRREIGIRPINKYKEMSFEIIYGDSYEVVVPPLSSESPTQQPLQDAVLVGKPFVVHFDRYLCDTLVPTLKLDQVLDCKWPFGYVGWYIPAERRTMFIGNNIAGGGVSGIEAPHITKGYNWKVDLHRGQFNAWGLVFDFDNAGNVFWPSGDRVGTITLINGDVSTE
jgi:hypothetical protein